MQQNRISVLTLAAWLAAAGSAYAGVIYDNGGPDQLVGYFGDTTSGQGFTQAADEFMLTAGSNTIGTVNWWGFCTTGPGSPSTCPTGNFTLYFYADNSNSPGALVTSFAVGNANQTATPNVDQGFFQEYSYSANIPGGLTLTAGTQYWLAIGNSTNDNWAFEATGPFAVGDEYSYCSVASLCTVGWISADSTFHGSIPEELAFNLTGPAGTSAVPEPGTLAIIGSGLLGLAGLRRRRKVT